MSNLPAESIAPPGTFRRLDVGGLFPFVLGASKLLLALERLDRSSELPKKWQTDLRCRSGVMKHSLRILNHFTVPFAYPLPDENAAEPRLLSFKSAYRKPDCSTLKQHML